MSQSPNSIDCPRATGMPIFGLGTWKNSEFDTCAESVATALDMGYRHIDTAQAYGNEAAVGAGIERSDVDRDEMFVATKVWIDNLAREDVLATTEASLDRLDLDRVDLLYIHWPARTYDPETTLGAFNELVDEGLIDAIGVSNFEPAQLADAVERSAAPILANQVEIHPLLPQEAIREACTDLGVEPVAYSPLARGDVFGVPELQSIADAHEVSPAQVSLAWLRQAGVTAIPKATSEAHIRENWESLALSLTPAEMERIASIGRTDRKVDPEFGPWNA